MAIENLSLIDDIGGLTIKTIGGLTINQYIYIYIYRWYSHWNLHRLSGFSVASIPNSGQTKSCVTADQRQLGELSSFQDLNMMPPLGLRGAMIFQSSNKIPTKSMTPVLPFTIPLNFGPPCLHQGTLRPSRRPCGRLASPSASSWSVWDDLLLGWTQVTHGFFWEHVFGKTAMFTYVYTYHMLYIQLYMCGLEATWLRLGGHSSKLPTKFGDPLNLPIPIYRSLKITKSHYKSLYICQFLP